MCALAAHQNVRAHKELLQQSEAVPALLHALEEVWLNTCSAEILFYLADRWALQHPLPHPPVIFTSRITSTSSPRATGAKGVRDSQVTLYPCPEERQIAETAGYWQVGFARHHDSPASKMNGSRVSPVISSLSAKAGMRGIIKVII